MKNEAAEEILYFVPHGPGLCYGVRMKFFRTARICAAFLADPQGAELITANLQRPNQMSPSICDTP